jgi:hypothetical protein
MEDNPGRAWRFWQRDRLTIDDVAEILERSRKSAYIWLHRNGVSTRREHVRRDEFEKGLSTTLSAKANEKPLIESAHSLLADHPTAVRFEIVTVKQVIRVRNVYRWRRMKRISPPGPGSLGRDAKPYGVVLDAEGKIAWGRADIGGDPIVVADSEKVTDAHLAGLRSEGVSYFFAGKTDIDPGSTLEIP